MHDGASEPGTRRGLRDRWSDVPARTPDATFIDIALVLVVLLELWAESTFRDSPYWATAGALPSGLDSLPPGVATWEAALFWTGFAGAHVAALLLPLRRHLPQLTLPALLLLAALVSPLSLVLVLVFTYARHCRRLPAVVFAVVAFTVVMAPPFPAVAQPADVTPLSLLLYAALFAAVTLYGMYSATRADLVVELRQQASFAESDAALREEQARQAERTRIAREMHDVVAHKISLVALQSGGLEMNPTVGPDRVEETASLIRTTATRALTDLREVLGVLREDESVPELVPQPTWADIPALVAQSRVAGIEVELFDFVAGTVSDSMARTVHRVIQESLTNIHKHAPGAPARVALMGEPGGSLAVEVANPLDVDGGTLPGTRMGLSGLETRVEHAGGTFTAGPTEDGYFTVRAEIPWKHEDPE